MAVLDDNTNHSGYLIAAKQVRGIRVYSFALEELGSVEDLLIDSTTGRVVYVVLKFGGLFGVGTRHCSLRWERFRYNTELRGYIVDVCIDHDRLVMASSRASQTKPHET